MKILILTKSFEREVTCLVNHLSARNPDIEFHVILPATSTVVLPVPVSLRKLNWAHHMRAAWFSSRVFADIQRFQPDIIQVFEEFSSLIAFQTLLFRNLCCRQSKTMIYAAENIPGNVGAIFRLPARYVMRYSDLAFVCSQGVKHVLQAEGYPHPIEVFPLGVDTDAFQKCGSPQLKRDLALDGKFVLGYVGRLLRIKGVFDILEIMLPGATYNYFAFLQ